MSFTDKHSSRRQLHQVSTRNEHQTYICEHNGCKQRNATGG